MLRGATGEGRDGSGAHRASWSLQTRCPGQRPARCSCSPQRSCTKQIQVSDSADRALSGKRRGKRQHAARREAHQTEPRLDVNESAMMLLLLLIEQAACATLAQDSASRTTVAAARASELISRLGDRARRTAARSGAQPGARVSGFVADLRARRHGTLRPICAHEWVSSGARRRGMHPGADKQRRHTVARRSQLFETSAHPRSPLRGADCRESLGQTAQRRFGAASDFSALLAAGPICVCASCGTRIGSPTKWIRGSWLRYRAAKTIGNCFAHSICWTLHLSSARCHECRATAVAHVPA